MHLADPAGDQPPAPQGVHAVDPKLNVLVPGSHARHSDLPSYGLKWPWLHKAQADKPVAATVVELVPTGHAVHVAVPLSAL